MTEELLSKLGLNCADITLPEDVSSSSINSDDMPQLSSTPVNPNKTANSALIWEILNKMSSLSNVKFQNSPANKENNESGLQLKEPLSLGTSYINILIFLAIAWKILVLFFILSDKGSKMELITTLHTASK